MTTHSHAPAGAGAAASAASTASAASAAPPNADNAAPTRAPATRPPAALPAAPLLALLDATPHARDGVAYVGRLLEQALAELYGAPVPRVSLDPRTLFNATVAERIAWIRRTTVGRCLLRHIH